MNSLVRSLQRISANSQRIHGLRQLRQPGQLRQLGQLSMSPRCFGTHKPKPVQATKVPDTKVPDKQQDQTTNNSNNSIQSLSNNSSLTLFEHILRIVGGLPLCFGGFYTVKKTHVSVIEYFGKFHDQKGEGLRFNLPFGRKYKSVFIGLRSLNIDKATVLDKHGNPVIVSAMLTFFVNDPVKFVYNCDDPLAFLSNQASACIKDIASKYSYDELKNETADITIEATDKIQKLCEMSGIKIERLNLIDLSYSKEIAQAMLVKQQALAHIEARKVIVDSSITIVKDILDKMELDEKSRNKAAVNLLTVLVSNSGTQNVISLN